MQPNINPEEQFPQELGNDPLIAQPMADFGGGAFVPAADPPKRRNPLSAIVALVLAIALIVGFSASLYLRSHGKTTIQLHGPTQAFGILNQVGQSNLRDTSSP